MIACTVLRRGHDRYEKQPGVFFLVDGTAAEQRAATVAIVAALSRVVVGCVLVKLANVYQTEPSEIIFRAEETIVGVTEPSDKPIEVTVSKAAQFTLCYDCLHKYACQRAQQGVVMCLSFDALPRPPGPERAPIADRHRR